ncbi:MAG: peptide deformylase [Burkholderiales bacterium]
MAILDVLTYPDPLLQRIAEPVKLIDNKIKKLVDDMAETMYDAPGIGLAATQVDVHEQVIVVDVSESRDQLMVFVNPRIVASSHELRPHEEGCLSVPGFYDDVTRPARIEVEALDLDGKVFRLQAEGLLAVCVQHEMDHLQGKVFVQHLSRLKQARIRSRMLKLEKERRQEDTATASERSA